MCLDRLLLLKPSSFIEKEHCNKTVQQELKYRPTNHTRFFSDVDMNRHVLRGVKHFRNFLHYQNIL